MKIEVLVATMHLKNAEDAKALYIKMNLQTDAVIVNQSDFNSYEEFSVKGHAVKFISSTERGISRSRNMALRYATAELCAIADDDCVYYDNYEQTIVKAFQQSSEASIIAFRTKQMKNGKIIIKKYPSKRKKINLFSLGKITSYEIVIRKSDLLSHNIQFDMRFGTGSSIYNFGEENILIYDSIRQRLKACREIDFILETNKDHSSWFVGHNEKYFYDMGAIIVRIRGRFAVCFYIANTFRKYNLYKNRMTGFQVFNCMLQGGKDYRITYRKE